jgi:hypothetical protein
MKRLLQHSLAAAMTAALLGGPAVSATADVIFPPDSGVIDVTDYGAVPDDEGDDYAAIQRALDQHPSGNHVFYFPAGTYLLSETLRPALDDGVTKRNIFQGQNRRTTILKLIDGLDHRDAVIDYRSGPAQFFRNAVRDLTIDVGRGNPQASGLKFNASNQGTVSHVTIRAADGSGRVGLDLRHSDEVGPLLVRDVEIVGFAVGIWSAWQTASQTLEDITLRDQTEIGWVNEASQSVFAHRVRSAGEVTAIWNAPWKLPGSGQGKFLLVDAVLQGTGPAAEKVAAIRNQKAMYVRDVQTPGFGRALQSTQIGFRGNGSIDDDRLEEYWANGTADSRRGGPAALFPSPPRSLHLPIRNAPALRLETDLSRWDGPHRHGGEANDGRDDTAAIQAAIDSGAKTVYLPRGTWQLEGTITLGSEVVHFLGTEAHLAGRGTVRIVGDHDDPIRIERLQGGGVTYEHAGNRTVVFRHLLGWTYRPARPGVGDVFVEDVVGAPVVFRQQNVWARQLDIEGDIEDRPDIEAKIVNDGGSLWILGFKTEDDGTHILTRSGGQTEVLGALHVGGGTAGPRFVTENADFTAALVNGGTDRVREIRGDETRDGRFGHADLYTASSSTDTDIIYIDNTDPSAVEIRGEWETVASPPGGFIGDNLLRAAADSGGQVAFIPRISQSGRYAVALRWIDQISSPIQYGRRVPVQVIHRDGRTMLSLDQRRSGGQWNPLGEFEFASGSEAKIIIGTEGAGGHVQADAVRVRRLE